MRKKLSCLILVLIFIISTVCANAHAIVASDNSTSAFGFNFYNYRYFLDDYNNGKFGDEVYYLASRGGQGDIAVFQKDGLVMVVLYQNWGRYQERTLRADEYQNLLSYIQENKIDALPDWDTERISDGVEYEYLHFTADKKSAVYINNPGAVKGENDELYRGLVSLFWDLMKSGEFEVHYYIDNAEILIRNEDYSVQSVWKNGDDFRVLIKDEENSTYNYDKLDWYTFDNHCVGNIADEPDGIRIKGAWDDVSPERLFGSQHFNNYPWQTAWGNYFVRALDHGLFLTAQGETPKLVVKGWYSSPVVIPNTDWVVCEKSINGWQNPRQLVRINLKTSEEIEMALPPSASVSPQVLLNGRLLVIRITEDAYEQYFYDIATDTLEKVYGDFACVSDLKGRFLQASSEPDKYFALDGQHKIGIFDTKEYTFTEIAQTPLLIDDNDHMWIDEKDGKAYIVVNEDLISIPIKTSIDYESDITVTLNEKPLAFDQPPIIQNGRVLVPMRKIFEALGASVVWSKEDQLIIAVKGKTAVLIKIGEDTFSVIDLSKQIGWNDFRHTVHGSGGAEPDAFDISSIAEKYTFDVSPQIINDRTLIPLRAVGESLGINVEWCAETRTVSLSCDLDFLFKRNDVSQTGNLASCYEVFFKK